MKKCKNCKSKVGLRKVVYGLPAGPVDDQKYRLGGCCPTDQSPLWICLVCGWQLLPGKNGLEDSIH